MTDENMELAREALTGWQPIETAPKGRLIDIWITNSSGGVRWTECYYDSICGQWRTTRPGGHLLTIGERFVTHWMEAPPPPIPESASSKIGGDHG